MSFASYDVLCINHHGNKTVGSGLQIIAPDLEYLENLCKAQTSIIVLLPLQLDSSGWLCFGRNTKLLLWQISSGYNWDKSKENSWTNPLDNWESVGAVWLFPWKLFSRNPPPHCIVQINWLEEKIKRNPTQRFHWTAFEMISSPEILNFSTDQL